MNPVCVSSWSGDRKFLRWFLASASKHEIEVINGDDTSWSGWHCKSIFQYNFIKKHKKDYTHFLFVDSYDSLFCAGWGEILWKYLKINKPIVFAAEPYCWPNIHQIPAYPSTNHRCRYLNAGMWIGEAEAAMELMEWIIPKARNAEKCDQGLSVDAFLTGKFPMTLDYKGELCHCLCLDGKQFLKYDEGRMVNIHSGVRPVLLHGNAGVAMQEYFEPLGVDHIKP